MKQTLGSVELLPRGVSSSNAMACCSRGPCPQAATATAILHLVGGLPSCQRKKKKRQGTDGGGGNGVDLVRCRGRRLGDARISNNTSFAPIIIYRVSATRTRIKALAPGFQCRRLPNRHSPWSSLFPSCSAPQCLADVCQCTACHDVPPPFPCKLVPLGTLRLEPKSQRPVPGLGRH
ncbi:hypothetical protein IF2G_06859 [Cordyceps javanica]|nr:hypothetical protein IF2G_06859 [Cordyceps javanica]